MQRKILAIALSLALLSSLFVFASPVSAKWWRPPVEKFDISFDTTGRYADPV